MPLPPESIAICNKAKLEGNKHLQLPVALAFWCQIWLVDQGIFWEEVQQAAKKWTLESNC